MMELQCIQRWFVLRDYMRSNNLRSVFFGDGKWLSGLSLRKMISLYNAGN